MKTTKTVKIKHILFFFLLAAFTSCNVYKGQKIERKQRGLKLISGAKLYKEVTANYLDYKSLNLKKITISYQEGNKTQHFRGSVRILKDSIIWLSFSKLGMEGARVKLTPSKVLLLDRLHREYLETYYQYLNKKFNIELNFFLIQSLLTNELPEYRIKTDSPFYQNFRRKRTRSHYVFYSKKRKLKKYWKEQQNKTGNFGSTLEILKISADLMRLETISILDKQLFLDQSEQTVHLELNYENYKKYDNQFLFPSQISTKVKRDLKKSGETKSRKTDNISLIISIEKMEVNPKNLSYPFRISHKYKRINE